MGDVAGDMADLAGNVGVKRTGPCHEPAALVGVHVMNVHDRIENALPGREDGAVAAANDAGIEETVGLEQVASRRPAIANHRMERATVAHQADIGVEPMGLDIGDGAGIGATR